MTYTLYKITERHTKGCIEDESESFSYKVDYRLIEDGSKEDEEFGESMASDYGYQDYNFSIGCKRVAIFDSLETAKDAARTIIEDAKKIEDKLIAEVISYETDQFGDIIEVRI
jgi:hypothetical protein